MHLGKELSTGIAADEEEDVAAAPAEDRGARAPEQPPVKAEQPAPAAAR
jgi:hypothetical protein